MKSWEHLPTVVNIGFKCFIAFLQILVRDPITRTWHPAHRGRLGLNPLEIQLVVLLMERALNLSPQNKPQEGRRRASIKP